MSGPCKSVKPQIHNLKRRGSHRDRLILQNSVETTESDAHYQNIEERKTGEQTIVLGKGQGRKDESHYRKALKDGILQGKGNESLKRKISKELPN